MRNQKNGEYLSYQQLVQQYAQLLNEINTLLPKNRKKKLPPDLLLMGSDRLREHIICLKVDLNVYRKYTKKK